jgi:hypothetical protein
MIQNPITFVISNNGTILDAQRGTIRALSNYASKIYVVAPFESVSLRVNYLIYDIKREVIGQYLAPTSLKGKDVLSPNDTQFQVAREWQVWEASISQRALHRIAKYRAGRVGVSFQVNTIGIPSQIVLNTGYKGIITETTQLDDPQDYEGNVGDYYVVDRYNIGTEFVTGLLTKGDYVYFTGTQWLKGQNIKQVAMTTTTDLAVDPSLLAELPEDISEDAELQDLIDELIGDVADLTTLVGDHIDDLNDPHDTQANQVETTGFGAVTSNVQDDLDALDTRIDDIEAGDTDITYDPTTDDIVDATTVAGAIGQLDSALYTHITDLDNPHDVNASQVDVTHQNETVSVQTAINDLQADKVEKNPSQYTNLLIESDQVYVKVGGDEKLITLTNLRSSIIDDVVAFGYVVFTSKDPFGQPMLFNSPQTNKIYLYNPSDSNVANDQYEEWIWVADDNTFELIGTTQIELDDYYDKDETDQLIQVAKQIQYYPNTRNTSGSLIPKGAVVQFAGSQGDYIEIKQAVSGTGDDTIGADPELLMGLAESDIANNAFGNVVWFGNIFNVSTGSFTTGQKLWFDTTTGGLRGTEPDTNKILVAVVEKASGGTSGILLVRPKWVSRDIAEVDGLTDALAGKSAVGHTHPISDVVNLQTELDTVGQLVDDNTSLGLGALEGLDGGRFNTAFGWASLASNTTGDRNSALGLNSGRYIADGSTLNQTGSNSVFVGSSTKALANGQTNQIVIGHNATGIGSNTVTLGNDSIVTTALKGNVGINETIPSGQLQIKSSAVDKVPLIVDTITSNLADLQLWRVNNVLRARVENDGSFRMLEARNLSSLNNSTVRFDATGTVISRNVADANDALTVNLANASSTGLILDAQAAGTTVASIAKNGTVTAPSVVATSTVKIGAWTLSQNGTSGSLDFVVV